MDAIFLYTPPGSEAVPEPVPASDLPTRACCCPARPVVQVIIPRTASRPNETDLLLCGHHYRVSSKALAALHATAIRLPEAPDSPPAALLPDLPRQRVPAW